MCATVSFAPTNLRYSPDRRPDRIAFLRNLRAVREYTSEPTADNVLDDNLEVGRWSRSASNYQWAEVVVVTDPAINHEGACGARLLARIAILS